MSGLTLLQKTGTLFNVTSDIGLGCLLETSHSGKEIAATPPG